MTDRWTEFGSPGTPGIDGDKWWDKAGINVEVERRKKMDLVRGPFL